MADTPPFSVVVVDEQWTSKEASDRIRRTGGPLLVVVAPAGFADLKTEQELRQWFKELKALNKDRPLVLATKNKASQRAAKAEGWKIMNGIRQLKLTLKGSEMS